MEKILAFRVLILLISWSHLMCLPETYFLFQMVMVIFMTIRWPMQKDHVEECSCRCVLLALWDLHCSLGVGAVFLDSHAPPQPLHDSGMPLLAPGWRHRVWLWIRARLSGQRSQRSYSCPWLSQPWSLGLPFCSGLDSKDSLIKSSSHGTLLWVSVTFQEHSFFLLYSLFSHLWCIQVVLGLKAILPQ